MQWDRVATSWLNTFSGVNRLADLAFIVITLGGPGLMVALIALRWWPREEHFARRHLAIRCGMATALGLLSNQIVLLFLHRQRPYEIGLTHLIIQKSADPSFPSDHATVGAAITATLILSKDKWWSAFFLLFVLIGLSRVYVGTHYVTDVLGGSFTGVVGACGVAWLYNRLEQVTRRIVKVL